MTTLPISLLILLLIVFLLVVGGNAIEVPKDLPTAVRFATVGQPTTTFNQDRFLQAMVYGADLMKPVEAEVPRVMVVHCDEDWAKWSNMNLSIGLMLYTPTDKGPYELWVAGDFTDVKMAVAAANIYRYAYNLSTEDATKYAGVILTMLRSTTDVASWQPKDSGTRKNGKH